MTPLPLRLQLSRRKGFNLQALSRSVNGLEAVNCARPSKHGNPFRVGGWFKLGDPDGTRRALSMSWCEALMPQHQRPPFTKIETTAQAVNFFERLCARQRPSGLKELNGKNLACWCGLCVVHKAGRPFNVNCTLCPPCHCDVLLILANAPRCEEVRAS